MTDEELSRLRALCSEAGRKIEALKEGLIAATVIPEGPHPFPATTGGAPRAVLAIGTANAKKGAEATVELRLVCPEAIAGIWINLRHSPRLEFLSAKSRVKSRAFRVDPGENHFQALLMFSTDLESGSAVPPEVDSERTGVVILAPNIVILEAAYRLPADATPGQRFVVQAGSAGFDIPGTSSQKLRTRILNWGRGADAGFEPAVEDGAIVVTG